MAEDIALFCVRGGEVGSRVRKIGERDAGAGTGLALAGLQHQQQQQPSNHQKPHQPNHHRPGGDDNTAVNSSGAQTHINCSSSVRGGSLGRMDPLDEFPVGMKVLVVDDDPVCLTILEHLLRKCSYRGSSFFFSFFFPPLNCFANQRFAAEMHQLGSVEVCSGVLSLSLYHSTQAIILVFLRRRSTSVTIPITL